MSRRIVTEQPAITLVVKKFGDLWEATIKGEHGFEIGKTKEQALVKLLVSEQKRLGITIEGLEDGKV